MTPSRVLVAGANGQLGGVIVRKLAAAGIPVRALGRDAQKLRSFSGTAGVEIAPVDMMNLAALTEACRGVEQIVSTANNNMGKGATSPAKIDLTAHQNLCAAARKAGVRRLLYVSAAGIDQDSPVDVFRIKWYIEDAIRRSGVPYVIVRPSAFMDIWVDQILADGIRRKGVATVFGPGTARSNYIAVEDVAEFVVKIVGRDEVVNEAIEIGGPTTMSMNEVATLVEKQLGRGGRRRHIPVFAMKLLPPVIRLFDERTARLMTFGYFATEDHPLPAWEKAAERFSVQPRTLEEYVATLDRRG